MTILFTFIARITDGVMLVASLDSSQSSSSFEAQKSTGRAVIRELSSQSPRQCSLEAGGFTFHYLIEDLVVYLTLTSKAFPKQNVFSYLQTLNETFQRFVAFQSGGKQWDSVVSTVDRPYAFIKFDKEIQKLSKDFSDPNSKKNMSKLSSEILEVQNIMKKNIQDVLGRGDRLEKAAETSSNLVHESKRFSSKAKKLNWIHFYKTYGPIAAVVFLFLLLLYYHLR
eukprot:snap_masked-scaffold_2-processed-gene-18.22-mRNA-1 protein AED:0.13 eAED:0.15 QI:0/0/0/1/1/1/2/0/224